MLIHFDVGLSVTTCHKEWTDWFVRWLENPSTGSIPPSIVLRDDTGKALQLAGWLKGSERYMRLSEHVFLREYFGFQDDDRYKNVFGHVSEHLEREWRFLGVWLLISSVMALLLFFEKRIEATILKGDIAGFNEAVREQCKAILVMPLHNLPPTIYLVQCLESMLCWRRVPDASTPMEKKRLLGYYRGLSVFRRRLLGFSLHKANPHSPAMQIFRMLTDHSCQSIKHVSQKAVLITTQASPQWNARVELLRSKMKTFSEEERKLVAQMEIGNDAKAVFGTDALEDARQYGMGSWETALNPDFMNKLNPYEYFQQQIQDLSRICDKITSILEDNANDLNSSLIAEELEQCKELFIRIMRDLRLRYYFGAVLLGVELSPVRGFILLVKTLRNVCKQINLLVSDFTR